MPQREEELRCSFCNNGQSEVRKLIAGPFVFICDECVKICNKIVDAGPNDPWVSTGYAEMPKRPTH